MDQQLRLVEVFVTPFKAPHSLHRPVYLCVAKVWLDCHVAHLWVLFPSPLTSRLELTEAQVPLCIPVADSREGLL